MNSSNNDIKKDERTVGDRIVDGAKETGKQVGDGIETMGKETKDWFSGETDAKEKREHQTLGEQMSDGFESAQKQTKEFFYPPKEEDKTLGEKFHESAVATGVQAGKNIEQFGKDTKEVCTDEPQSFGDRVKENVNDASVKFHDGLDTLKDSVSRQMESTKQMGKEWYDSMTNQGDSAIQTDLNAAGENIQAAAEKAKLDIHKGADEMQGDIQKGVEKMHQNGKDLYNTMGEKLQTDSNSIDSENSRPNVAAH